MVIDCGSVGKTDDDLTSTEAGAYLSGVLALHTASPNLVLSHGHVDHYAWIDNVLPNVQIDEL